MTAIDILEHINWLTSYAFFPTEQTWTRIDDWLERARAAGERFGFADLLIAAIAVDHHAEIWSFDTHFMRMGRAGFIGIYKM